MQLWLEQNLVPIRNSHECAQLPATTDNHDFMPSAECPVMSPIAQTQQNAQPLAYLKMAKQASPPSISALGCLPRSKAVHGKQQRGDRTTSSSFTNRNSNPPVHLLIATRILQLFKRDPTVPSEQRVDVNALVQGAKTALGRDIV